jgi:phosphate starvation-inducible PhoH-like protein
MDKLTSRFSPTPGQKLLAQSIWQNDYTVVVGSAGVGKSCITLQTFLDMMIQKHIQKIVVVRLITETCDEHLGALPGDKSEKLDPFMAPILDNLHQLMGEGQLSYLLDKSKIEVVPVSHARGRTFMDAGVLVDEAQNLSDSMILTMLTRLGEGSRMVISGDPEQVDIPGRNGILYARRLLKNMDGVGDIYLDDSNIKRHPMIAEILRRARELKNQ